MTNKKLNGYKSQIKAPLSLTHSNRFILDVHELIKPEFERICTSIEQHLNVKLLLQTIETSSSSFRCAIQCSANNLSAKTCLRVIELLRTKATKLGGSLSFETISSG